MANILWRKIWLQIRTRHHAATIKTTPFDGRHATAAPLVVFRREKIEPHQDHGVTFDWRMPTQRFAMTS